MIIYLASVIRRACTAGDRRVQEYDTIVNESARNVEGESSITEMICASEPARRQNQFCMSSLRSDRHLPNAVNIEVSRTTPAKGRLHRMLLGRIGGSVIEPVGVHSAVNVRKFK